MCLYHHIVNCALVNFQLFIYCCNIVRETRVETAVACWTHVALQHNMKRSFTDVLACHKKGGTHYSADFDELKDAVFSHINHNQDINKLTEEATYSIKKHKDIDGENSVGGLFSALKDQAALSEVPLSSLAATVCARKLSTVINNEDEGVLLEQDEQATVQMVIGVIKQVQRETGFNRLSFIKAINKGKSLSIELVWRLHESGIMTLEAYFKCNLESPGVIGGFPVALINISKCEPDDETIKLRQRIIKDIIGFLILHGFKDKPADGSSVSKGMKRVAAAVLKTIAKKVLVDEGKTPTFCLYEMVMQPSRDLQKETLKIFSVQQISVMLRHSPVHTVSEALQQQAHWTYGKSPSWITAIFTNLLSVLEPVEALDVLSRTLEQQEVNWKSALTFLATFLVLFSEAPGLLQDKVTSLLAVGLENCEMDALILAFLLVRQGSLEGRHIFPDYQDWFAKTFSDSSRSPASSRKSFTFLMKFLTDIVPYDDVNSLKVHIHRPAAPPPTCRPLLSDYIVLAKTRLQDLQVPVDDGTVYDGGQTTADKEKAEKQSEQDVEAALAAFDKTGKVPSSVMEASIFRKPYFIGRFIPALLKPRPLPDDPDVRMTFISTLRRADKIPSSLYNNYEKACQKISTDLLEGLMSDDDDSMEELLLTPFEQLENAMSTLAEAVMKFHSGHKTKTGMSGHISIISEKITALLTPEPQTSRITDKSLLIDVTSPDQSPIALKIVDCVLDTVCKILIGLSTNTSPQGSWLQQLLQSLSHYGAVWSALLYKSWLLLVKHGSRLAPCHVNGLAAVIVHLASEVVPSHTVTVKEGKICGPYVDTLLQVLPSHSKDWMRFTLRFCTCYIQHALRTFPEFTLYYNETQKAVIPPAIINKFQYLLNRLCPESRCDQSLDDGSPEDSEMALPVAIYRNELVSFLISSSSLSFTDWVKLEIHVFAHDEVLSCWQRQDYSYWMVGCYSKKLPHTPDVYTELCSDLMNGILDYDLRLHDDPHACPCQTSLSEANSTCQLSNRGNSRDHMTSLLQSLLPLLPPAARPPHQDMREADQDDVAEAVPWLGAVWQRRQQKLDTDQYSISRHLEHLAFYRLARILYPTYFWNRPIIT